MEAARRYRGVSSRRLFLRDSLGRFGPRCGSGVRAGARTADAEIAHGGVGLWPAISPFVARFLIIPWPKICRHDCRHGRPEAHSTIGLIKASEVALCSGR